MFTVSVDYLFRLRSFLDGPVPGFDPTNEQECNDRVKLIVGTRVSRDGEGCVVCEDHMIGFEIVGTTFRVVGRSSVDKADALLDMIAVMWSMKNEWRAREVVANRRRAMVWRESHPCPRGRDYR